MPLSHQRKNELLYKETKEGDELVEQPLLGIISSSQYLETSR
jgi:hypothetical protein